MKSSFKQNIKSNTIYTDDFPKWTTRAEFNDIILKYPQYDEQYVWSGSIAEQRDHFDYLWNIFKPYADKHFLTDVKKQFHQRTWEMLVGVVLLNHGFKLENPGEGPDFILNNSIYIECIAVNKGDENNSESVPEKPHSGFEWTPVDKILLRLTSGIDKKYSKYKKVWAKKKWFNSSSPYLIALNAGALKRPQMCPPEFPHIAQVLYGVGGSVYQFEIGSNPKNQKGKFFHKYRKAIDKKNVSVSSDLFLKKEYNVISGIIYSDLEILRLSGTGSSLIYLSNENARNPIDKEILTCLRKLYREERNDGFADFRIER